MDGSQPMKCAGKGKSNGKAARCSAAVQFIFICHWEWCAVGSHHRSIHDVIQSPSHRGPGREFVARSADTQCGVDEG